MKFIRFEDIIAWQKSRKIVLIIYQEFRICKDFSFKNQIERAAVSIMNNIAEGYEKMTNKDFKNFLSIAKGSAGEVRSMIYLAKDLKYISVNIAADCNRRLIEIARILSGLIKSL